MARTKKKGKQWNRHGKRRRVRPDVFQESYEAGLTAEKFHEYYKAQGFVPEGEWDDFIQTLSTALPVAFRISARDDRVVTKLHEKFHEIAQTIKPFEIDGKMCKPPAEASWLPGAKAFNMDATRSALRKQPELKELFNFMVAATHAGLISRQELVSMVPPLLLNVQPQHVVLDMCASPGSKTMQLLEAIYSEGPDPPGAVIANDNDTKRAYMLVHRCKAAGTHALTVTCHDAQGFPEVEINPKAAGPFSEESKTPETAMLRFDRVLCDVPCSGDGTVRKNPQIWRRFSPYNGLGLHDLQLAIAARGLQVLKDGGLMTYSTCTFNPIENEAVVAELLRWGGDSVEVVDVSSKFPDMKRVMGITSWEVFSPQMTKVPSYEEAAMGHHHIIRDTMFPMIKRTDVSEEEKKRIDGQLPNCLRLLPHYHNTGGFFIALLKKTGPVPGELPEVPSTKRRVDLLKRLMAEEKIDPSSLHAKDKVLLEKGEKKEDNTGVSAKDLSLHSGRHELRSFEPLTEEIRSSIVKQYRVDESTAPVQRLFTRGGSEKSIWFASEVIASILRTQQDTLRIIGGGGKLFDGGGRRVPSYRMVSEAADEFVPYSPEFLIPVSKTTFLKVLNSPIGRNFHHSDFDADFVQRLESLPRHRTVILMVGWVDAEGSTKVEPEDSEALAKTIHQRPHILAWRGKETLMLMASKENKQAVAYTLEFLGLATKEELQESISGDGLQNVKPKSAKKSESEERESTPTPSASAEGQEESKAQEDVEMSTSSGADAGASAE